jgi:hypothetical protein
VGHRKENFKMEREPWYKNQPYKPTDGGYRLDKSEEMR